jgi:hypothetical protein
VRYALLGRSVRSSCELDVVHHRVDVGLVEVVVRRRGLGQQLRQSHETVGDRGEGERPSNAVRAAPHQAPHAANRLHPAKRFLDTLANALARAVAGTNGKPAQASRHVRSYVHRAQLIHEVGRILRIKPEGRLLSCRPRA